MERDSYLDGIHSAWLGEQFGEVFFSALADRALDDTMRDKWQRLAQLENVTGKRMAGILEAYGQAPTAGDIEVGDDILSRYTNVSHHDAMLGMRDVVEKAIIHFDQLLAVAPEQDVPQVQFLVQHEQALLTFVERELAGDGGNALEAVDALLADG